MSFLLHKVYQIKYQKNLLGPETRTLDAVAVGWTTFATLLVIGSLGEDIILTPETIKLPNVQLKL